MDNILNKFEDHINNMLKRNGWKVVLPKELLIKYKTITSYKEDLGISPVKANKILEEMGFIERQNKTGILLTEKGEQHGLQLLSFFASQKNNGLLISENAFVYWKNSIVDEIKKFRKEGKNKK